MTADDKPTPTAPPASPPSPRPFGTESIEKGDKDPSTVRK